MRAGLSTYALAHRLGASQSKISKVENGHVAISIGDVTAWAEATGATDQAPALAQRAEDALTEAVSWRAAIPDGGLASKQRDVMELERSASAIRVFQLAIVPGLLQTTAYARAIFLAHEPADHDAVGPAVAARLERQDVLWDSAKRFEFILGEEILQWQPGPPDVMLAQIDRIRNLATLPNVSVGVIPLRTRPWVWHTHGFVLFETGNDGPTFVHVEMLTAGLNISDDDDLAEFETALTRLRSVAVFGDAADAVLRENMDRLR